MDIYTSIPKHLWTLSNFQYLHKYDRKHDRSQVMLQIKGHQPFHVSGLEGKGVAGKFARTCMCVWKRGRVHPHASQKPHLHSCAGANHCCQPHAHAHAQKGHETRLCMHAGANHCRQPHRHAQTGCKTHMGLVAPVCAYTQVISTTTASPCMHEQKVHATHGCIRGPVSAGASLHQPCRATGASTSGGECARGSACLMAWWPVGHSPLGAAAHRLGIRVLNHIYVAILHCHGRYVGQLKGQRWVGEVER